MVNFALVHTFFRKSKNVYLYNSKKSAASPFYFAIIHFSFPALVMSYFCLRPLEFIKIQPTDLMSDPNGINDPASFILDPPLDFRLMTKGFSSSKHFVLCVFVIQRRRWDWGKQNIHFIDRKNWKVYNVLK